MRKEESGATGVAIELEADLLLDGDHFVDIHAPDPAARAALPAAQAPVQPTP